MWHPERSEYLYGAYGFEVLRPDEDGESEILKVTIEFDKGAVRIEGADNGFVFPTFDERYPTSVTIQDAYLIAYYGDTHFLQLKIEPAEGLVCDWYEYIEEGEELIDTVAIWWEDL